MVGAYGCHDDIGERVVQSGENERVGVAHFEYFTEDSEKENEGIDREEQ